MKFSADYLTEVQSLTKEMSKPNLGEDSPILIHCSAGVGRSGVLLMMDILTRAVDNNEVGLSPTMSFRI